jgi:hypothetical protein
MKFISIYVRLAGLEVGDKNLFSTYRMKNIVVPDFAGIANRDV